MATNDETRAHPQKDPDEWVTGDEPMTGPQASYLHTLAREAGEAGEAGEERLTKAEASKRIDALQEETGRGRPADEATDGHGPR